MARQKKNYELSKIKPYSGPVHSQEELVGHIANTFQDCLKIVAAKNKDYAGKGNAFSNFEKARVVGLEPEHGILIRMLDKLSRISNLIDTEGKVKDESVEDTLNDLINYSGILKAYIETRKATEKRT